MLSLSAVSSTLPRHCAHVTASGLIVLSAGFYLFGDYGGPARCFYLLIALPVLLMLPLRPNLLMPGTLQAVLFLPLPLYLALSSNWGLPVGSAAGDYWDLAKPALFLSLLLAGGCAALRFRPDLPQLLPKAIVIAAVPSALLGLAHYLPEALTSDNWPRMAGFSLRGDINVTAALHGFNCLLCVWGLHYWSSRWRIWLYCGLGLSLLSVLLSQSKVALLFSLLALIGLSWHKLQVKRQYTLLTGLLITGLLLAFFSNFERIPFLDRTEAYTVRIDLWQQSIAQWAKQPWLGHGLGADLGLTRFGQPYHSHSHNFLLGTLRYGGLLGVGLLLWQISGTLWLLWRRRSESVPEQNVILLWWLAGMAFLLTNGGQPLVKPHHTWFFYWIPLTLLLAGSAINAKPTDIPMRPRCQSAP